MSPPRLSRGITLALIANTIWGVAALYWIQTKPMAPIDVMAHRSLWTLPVMLLITLYFGQLRDTLRLLKSFRFALWIGLAATMLTINWGVYVFAVTSGRATEASLGYFTLPLMTIAIGVVVFGERPSRAQMFAILLGMIAVAVQVAAHGSLPWVSLVLALSFAVYGATRKRIKADASQGLFLEACCMAPFAVAWLLLNEGAGLGRYGIKVDLFLVLSGLFTAAPLITYVAATRLLSLSTLGLLTYVGPSIQLVVAIVILEEPVTIVTVATFTLVWLGIIVVTSEAWLRSRTSM